MAEEAKNELAVLRAEYKAIVGKNPSPRLDVEGLKAKIAELKEASPVEPASSPPVAEEAKAVEAEIPHGTALLDHEDPDAGASFNGVELARNKKGLFLVPLHAVDQLVAHGFKLVGAGK